MRAITPRPRTTAPSTSRTAPALVTAGVALALLLGGCTDDAPENPANTTPTLEPYGVDPETEATTVDDDAIVGQLPPTENELDEPAGEIVDADVAE